MNINNLNYRKNYILNDNGKIVLSMNFRVKESIFFIFLNFTKTENLKKIMHEVEILNLTDFDAFTFNTNEITNFHEEFNPKVESTGLIEFLTLVIGKITFLDILKELYDYINWVKLESRDLCIPVISNERVIFKFTQNMKSLENLAILEFENKSEVEIDIGILLNYSNQKNIFEALLFFISKISEVFEKRLNSYKVFIKDEVIFETYLLFQNNNCDYYGFIDKENITEPEYITSFRTESMLRFLIASKNLYLLSPFAQVLANDVERSADFKISRSVSRSQNGNRE